MNFMNLNKLLSHVCMFRSPNKTHKNLFSVSWFLISDKTKSITVGKNEPKVLKSVRHIRISLPIEFKLILELTYRKPTFIVNFYLSMQLQFDFFNLIF